MVSVPSFRKTFGYDYEGEAVIPASWLSGFNSISSVGQFFGGFACSWLSDRIGRKTIGQLKRRCGPRSPEFRYGPRHLGRTRGKPGKTGTDGHFSYYRARNSRKLRLSRFQLLRFDLDCSADHALPLTVWYVKRFPVSDRAGKLGTDEHISYFRGQRQLSFRPTWRSGMQCPLPSFSHVRKCKLTPLPNAGQKEPHGNLPARTQDPRRERQRERENC